MPRPSKIQKQEITGARKINIAETPDPQLLQDKQLWILTDEGLVNASASPAVFDQTIQKYMDFYDRTAWPLDQRLSVLEEGGSDIPLFIIEKPEDLPEDLRAQYEAGK